MIDTLIRINEDGILDLLSSEHNDWASLAIDLEDIAFDRPYFRGMEWHHIEPDREQLVALWPLEHLAIHICHAKLNPTDSTHAKVGAFVKSFPGSYRRIIDLSDVTHNLVLSFGQQRPSKDNIEMARIANLPQSKLAQRLNGLKNGSKNGKKSASKVSKKLKGREITWGDKISNALSNRPRCSCIVCHIEMAAHSGNIKQHIKSSKCVPHNPI